MKEHKKDNEHLILKAICTGALCVLMLMAFGFVSGADDMQNINEFYDDQGNYHMVNEKTGQEQVMNKGVKNVQ